MKILIATDGSQNALNAVAFAAKLTADLKSPATITLLSVHDDASLRHASQFVGKKQVEDYLADQSEKELEPARAALQGAGVAFTEDILIGHISERIVEFANEGQFDLLVLGAKGRSGIADLLLGSVAQRVLSTARQPVLLVK